MFSSSSSLEQMHPFGMPRPMPAGHRPWKPNVEIAPNCPRCDSPNTKFCYYNNYSLTQPRYFCKGCRRYWTKGGSLRNVPVGGGCRKNRRGKSAARLSSGRTTSTSTDKYYSRLHTSSSSSAAAAAAAAPLRPDLALDDMVGSSHQSLVSSLPDDTDQSSSRDASTIDLAALYSKFLNHCPEYAAAEGQAGRQGQFVAAEGPCGESYELGGGSEGEMGMMGELGYDPFDVACASGYESSLGMPDQSISPAEAFPALSSWQAPDHLQPGLCPFPGMGCDWSSLDQSSFGAF